MQKIWRTVYCNLGTPRVSKAQSRPRRIQYISHCPALYDSFSIGKARFVGFFFSFRLNPNSWLFSTDSLFFIRSTVEVMNKLQLMKSWTGLVPLMKSCDRFSPTASPGPFSLNKFSLFSFSDGHFGDLWVVNGNSPSPPAPPQHFIWQGTVKYPVLPWCAAITLESVGREKP